MNNRVSVIIPAHNEEAVIGRCLTALTTGAALDELEIIVVCNGCRDDTATIAREFGYPVRVVETETPSKANALNLGDAVAASFPRIYMDADVVLDIHSVRAIAGAFENPSVLAAAPSVETVFTLDTSWGVRAFYRFWMSLPYVKEGMMGAGVYAVSRSGRMRFGKFPLVIADDGYFRLQYSQSERTQVSSARSTVWSPNTLWDLILIKTRSRLGFFQMRKLYPELFDREAQTKHYGSAVLTTLRNPRLWLCSFPYVWVNLIARYRAWRQQRSLSQYVWERDDSTRNAKSKTSPARELSRS